MCAGRTPRFAAFKQHFLNFLPLPHGHGSFLPVFIFGVIAESCRWVTPYRRLVVRVRLQRDVSNWPNSDGRAGVNSRRLIGYRRTCRGRSSTRSVVDSVQRVAIRMATPVLSVKQSKRGFTGSFEIVAADKAGGWSVKRGPRRSLDGLFESGRQGLPNWDCAAEAHFKRGADRVSAAKLRRDNFSPRKC